MGASHKATAISWYLEFLTHLLLLLLQSIEVGLSYANIIITTCVLTHLSHTQNKQLPGPLSNPSSVH